MNEHHTQLDRSVAAPMFVASFIFLLCLAGLLHLYDGSELAELPPSVIFCAWGAVLLYPLFVGELILHRIAGSPLRRRDILCCLIPPLRVIGRDHTTGETTWLPLIGWTKVDDELRSRIEKGSTIPMIVIALMVLPLLAMDFFWREKMADEPSLAFLNHAGAGLIWLAFTFEFLVMISIVERKLRYCREHWIDIAIILLPLIAFMRLARLGRLLRLQQLTKTARVYRLRGMLMRTWRALLLLDTVDRLVRGSSEKRFLKLQTALTVKEDELEAIRLQIRELQTQVAEQQKPLRDAA